MKIVMSGLLKQIIDGFPSKNAAAERLGISYPTLMAYLAEERSCGDELIGVVTKTLGLDFEKAFTVVAEETP